MLSLKSTPSKVGGTVGFLARKASDSGMGIVERARERWGVVGGWDGEGEVGGLGCEELRVAWLLYGELGWVSAP